MVLEMSSAPYECQDCFGGHTLIRNGCSVTSVDENEMNWSSMRAIFQDPNYPNLLSTA